MLRPDVGDPERPAAGQAASAARPKTASRNLRSSTGSGSSRKRRRNPFPGATAYIRNTPKRLRSSIGALRLADRPRPSTRRVSAGSMMPSSHSRALA